MKRSKCVSVCLEEQKAAFQDFEHLFTNVKKFPSSKSSVFKDISRNLSFRMTPKALYLSAKRHFIEFFGEKNLQDDTDSNSTKSVNVDDDVSSSSDSITNSVESFKVDHDLWHIVKPKLVTGKRSDINKPGVPHKRRRRMPKSKWSNIFCEWIWLYTTSRCVWTFKNSSVTDEYHMKCTGTCKECNGKINIITNGNSDSVMLTCSFQNVDKNIIHTSKIKLASLKTKQLALKMQNQYPIVIRNKMINSTMQDDETREPPFVPTLKSLQNIRNRHDAEKRYHKIVVLALWIMSFTKPWVNVIRTVSLQPFFIHYWTELQLNFYKKVSKAYTVLSIDATGSIFKEISPPYSTSDYERKHLFLYVVMLKMNDNSVPLSQMISAVQTMDNIFQWLKKWIGGMKAPNEVICDDSAAIIGAVVNAFTRFTTTREYLSHCFKVLCHGERCQITCLLRLDTSHFLKSLYRLQCFKFIDIRVKSFYIRYLLALKSCMNFEVAKTIIENVIVVALQKYDRYLMDGSKSKCDKARDILKSFRLSSEDSMIIEQSDAQSHGDEIDTHEYTESFDNSFIAWFDAIVDSETVQSDLSDETDYENVYYLPNFVKCFRKLVLRLPLWSNVMFPYIPNTSDALDVASSSNIESYFKNIKTLLLHSRSGLMRVDDFVMKHTEYLTGELKAANCTDDFEKRECKHEDSKRQKNKEGNSKNGDFNEESVFKSSPKLEENWRNKTKNLNTTRLIEKIKPKTKEIEILPNGNICTSGIKNVVTTNTCAFDAILNALLVICIDYINISIFITSMDSAFSRLVSALVRKDVDVDCLKKRTEILQLYYKSTVQGHVKVIDCVCNVTFVLEKILIKDIFSATHSKTCSDCEMHITRKVPILPLNILMISDNGVGSLNESASSMLAIEVSDCKNTNCTGKVFAEYFISENLIFFELDLTLRLCEIPNELLICDKIFQLAAVVGFIPNFEGVGHYKTNCLRRNSQWECYDDMAAGAVPVKNDSIVNSHLLIYRRWKA